MFCVWRNNEDDWIKPAAGVGGSGGLFLTMSSDSSHGISKQSPKSQGAPATPWEEKSLDNEENGNLRKSIGSTDPAGDVCVWFWPEAPRDRFKFSIILPSVTESQRSGEADICWWEMWTMVTIVTEHDFCQSRQTIRHQWPQRGDFHETSIEFGQHQTIVRFSYSSQMFDWRLNWDNNNTSLQPRFGDQTKRFKETLMWEKRLSLWSSTVSEFWIIKQFFEK